MIKYAILMGALSCATPTPYLSRYYSGNLGNTMYECRKRNVQVMIVDDNNDGNANWVGISTDGGSTFCEPRHPRYTLDRATMAITRMSWNTSKACKTLFDDLGL